jgi:hypothetical protein
MHSQVAMPHRVYDVKCHAPDETLDAKVPVLRWAANVCGITKSVELMSNSQQVAEQLKGKDRLRSAAVVTAAILYSLIPAVGN